MRHARPGYVDEHADEAERTYGTFQHLVGLLSMLDGISVLGLIGAIIMWRIKAKTSPFLDDHGREEVNSQLSTLLYIVVIGICTIGIGLAVAIPVLWVMRLIFGIKAAMAANRGEYYRYPMCIRFIAAPTG